MTAASPTSTTTAGHHELSHLDALESEAVFIFREVAAELERPVLLFSGGKDSIVLLRLAEKAFRPAAFPFPVMHIDTGHNFPDVIDFRNRRVAELGERLVVASVQESIDSGRVFEDPNDPSRNRLQTTTLLDAVEAHGFDACFGGGRRDEEKARAKERVFSFRDRRTIGAGHHLVVASVQESIDRGRVADDGGGSRNRMQAVTLLDAIAEQGLDVCLGGGRRDEEKARAKERVFSFRDDFGQWDPKAQRPEVWSLYNGRIRKGEHIRAFPISNWTELDVWQYIEREHLEVPSMYFAHRREVVERDTMLLAVSEWIQPRPGERCYEATVRYRTVGDMNCTGAVESHAATVAEIIAEVAATRITERGATRADDRFSEAAMEDRKKEGYF